MSDWEKHPSFAKIGAYRTSIGPPGESLFDSDIRHAHTVVLRIEEAERRREIGHDFIHGGKRIVEVEMSEAQWASFVSSTNTSGVPCTLRWHGEDIEKPPYAPRLRESIAETHDAADRAFADIKAAFEEYVAHPTKAQLRSLRATIENATPNVDYAGKVLVEHAENVVQRARADVEAMVLAQADRLGIDPAFTPLQLDPAPE